MTVIVETLHSHIFGHPVTWDDDHEVYRYDDTGEIAHDSPRPCPQCGMLQTPEGHDPCLGTIPGAMSACCGHGVERGYVIWPTPGEKIRCLRQKNGWSQTELGSRMDRPRTHAAISDIERGVTEISFYDLMDLCSIFGVSVMYFLPTGDAA